MYSPRNNDGNKRATWKNANKLNCCESDSSIRGAKKLIHLYKMNMQNWATSIKVSLKARWHIKIKKEWDSALYMWFYSYVEVFQWFLMRFCSFVVICWWGALHYAGKTVYQGVEWAKCVYFMFVCACLVWEKKCDNDSVVYW